MAEVLPGDEEVPKPQREAEWQCLSWCHTAPTTHHEPSHVPSHLPGLSSKSSSTSNQRLHRGGSKAKEPKQRGGRLYPHSKTCQSSVRHLLSHSPTIPPRFGWKGHQDLPLVFLMSPTSGSPGQREAVLDEL